MGLLEPLAFPKHKLVDGSMNFTMGLPESNEGHDGILTVVDRATKDGTFSISETNNFSVRDWPCLVDQHWEGT